MIELYSGGFVDRSRPGEHVEVLVEAAGIEGRMRLDGDARLCPSRSLAEFRLPARRPPCRTEQCVFALRPGGAADIEWSGWLLVPDDRGAGPRDETGCLRRRAPLPVEHTFEVCGYVDHFGGARTCARAELTLPAAGDIVLAFEPDEGAVEDAP